MLSLNNNRLLTTFRTPIIAKSVTIARWPREVYDAYQRSLDNKKKFIVLGQGSNVLFVDNFDGEIIINKYQGIKVEADSNYFYLHINSGVTIDHLISYCHRFKIYGLENLSLIPSSIGTAVISNIGAYGIEFSEFVDYVDLLNLNTGEKLRFSSQDCNFSYRSSIFKTHYTNGYFITTVGIKIPKKYQARLDYFPLTKLNKETVTPHQVQQTVIATRKKRLPDFDIHGNAGSFFVNPIVPRELAEQITAKNSKIVTYEISDTETKLGAGSLIEQAELKDYKLNNARVYSDNCLVLINYECKTTGLDILKLASLVQHKVYQKFGIWLEPEVKIISSEINESSTQYLREVYNMYFK